MLPPKRCTRSTRLSSKAKAKEELVNTVEGISKDAAETSPKEDPKSKTSETGVKSKHLSTEWDDDQTLKVKGNSIKRVRRSLTNDQRKALEWVHTNIRKVKVCHNSKNIKAEIYLFIVLG